MLYSLTSGRKYLLRSGRAGVWYIFRILCLEARP